MRRSQRVLNKAIRNYLKVEYENPDEAECNFRIAVFDVLSVNINQSYLGNKIEQV